MTPTFELEAPLFPDFLDLHAKWYPNKAAVIDEQKQLTWSELQGNANRVANGLISLGVSPGQSVAVLMTNCVEYLEILYGIFKAGAVAVPLNTAVNDRGIVTMLEDADAKAFFCCSEQALRMRNSGILPGAIQTSLIEHTVGADRSQYSEWRETHNSELKPLHITEEAPCNIIYSSGTTGLPKGIKHTHRRRVQAMYELALAHRYHFGAVAICPIGLYSNIAWASVFCSLITGATCIIRKTFNPEQWIEDVANFGVTHTMMAPIMFQRILAASNFTPNKVASLQAVISGGSPLFQSLKEQVIRDFGCAVIELYGLTEGFMTTLQPEESEGKLTSVGKPVRGNDYILVDNDDRVVGFGGTGEICTRSVHWMIEYHNRPDATAEIEFRDPNGLLWMRTGDVGRTDEDGYLYIVDRKKDMILTAGYNVYPAEIERVVAGHQDVALVAVGSVPDEEKGELAKAYIVPKTGAQPNADDIINYCREHLAAYKVPRSVQFVDDLPKTSTGKVMRRELHSLDN